MNQITKRGKQIGKKFLYGSFYNLGWSKALASRRASAGKFILTYHNVLPESEMTPHYTNNVDVTTATFEFQIKMLKKLFGIQPASKIYDSAQKGIFISFDDGMLNNIEIVEPILAKYGVTAMFGICSGLLDGTIEYLWRDYLYLMLKELKGKKILISDLPSCSGKVVGKENLNHIAQAITEHIEKTGLMDDVYEYLFGIAKENQVTIQHKYVPKLRYTPMGIPDIQNLKEKGHVIASHTHTHRKLSMLSDSELNGELDLSKNYLTENLGSCDALVYPYGTIKEVDEKVGRFAEDNGYLLAFMNIRKSFEPENYFIPRLNMGNVSNNSEFLGLLAGVNKMF